MLHQIEWDSSDEVLAGSMEEPPHLSDFPQSKPSTTNISEHEFSCHCCYDILVNPTTLTCGHNFCRHCLALWWESSHKNECPECREKWEGFPKINILLRYAFHSQTKSGNDMFDFLTTVFTFPLCAVENRALLTTFKNDKCVCVTVWFKYTSM